MRTQGAAACLRHLHSALQHAPPLDGIHRRRWAAAAWFPAWRCSARVLAIQCPRLLVVPQMNSLSCGTSALPACPRCSGNLRTLAPWQSTGRWGSRELPVSSESACSLSNVFQQSACGALRCLNRLKHRTVQELAHLDCCAVHYDGRGQFWQDVAVTRRL